MPDVIDINSGDAIAARLAKLLERADVPDPYGLDAAPSAPPAHAKPVGGRVVVVPAPQGIVRIVGLGPDGQWIAEFSCLEEHFAEELVTRMQRHVARTTGIHLQLVAT